jgi:hypothetical protein
MKSRGLYFYLVNLTGFLLVVPKTKIILSAWLLKKLYDWKNQAGSSMRLPKYVYCRKISVSVH